jgi:hypothetical protein
MAEAAFAREIAVAASYIIDDPVITRRGNPARDVVEIKSFANSPGYIVVGAGRVTADAEAANEGAILIVKTQTTAKHIHTANLLTHQVVGCRTPSRG